MKLVATFTLVAAHAKEGGAASIACGHPIMKLSLAIRDRSGDVAQALLPAGVETLLDPLASSLPERRRLRGYATSAAVKLILRDR